MSAALLQMSQASLQNQDEVETDHKVPSLLIDGLSQAKCHTLALTPTRFSEIMVGLY